MPYLTVSQKYTIESMLKVRYKQSEIALVIGTDKSLVSREIKRNCNQKSGSYCHDLAQRKYHKSQKDKPKRVRFTTAVKADVNAL